MRIGGRAVLTERLLVAVLFGVLSVTAFALSLSLPPAVLEPLGPAAFPRVVSAVLLLLSLLALASALPRTAAPAPAVQRQRSGLAAIAVLLLIAYIGAMDLGLIGYRAATILFLFALGTLLADFSPRKSLAALSIAIAVGLGTHFIFTQFMYVDLP